ncbi:MAG: PH domain-containing protein [Anaerolineales bacterium]
MRQSSETWIYFPPPRRTGMVINVSGLLIAASLVILSLLSAVVQQPGLAVILLLLVAFLFTIPIPFLLYRLYALLQSGYWIGRNGLSLRWGLRFIDLPYEQVVDVARAEELESAPPLPRWSWPGSLMGQREDPDLGHVEFLASEAANLVMVGTASAVYVVSPRDPQEFVAAYKRESERGSLRPIASRSVLPSFVLAEAWREPRVPGLLVSGAVMAMGLLVLVGVLAPQIEVVSLGYGVDGQPLAPVAGVQLFLLPALNLFFYMGNFVLGLLFYRERQGIRFSTIVWGSSLVTSLLFLAAILFSL